MNMKSIRSSVWGALAAAGLVAVPALGQGAPQKIGVIEVQRIVQESAAGKESISRMQKIQAQKQEDLAKRQKELRDIEEKLQNQGASLSEEAKEKLNKEYQAKAIEMKRFQDDAQRELEETQRKELEALEKRVMPVIDTVAKEQGFSLLFNKFQSGLLFADPATDLTDQVIAKFNTALAAPPKAETKPAAAPAAPKK